GAGDPAVLLVAARQVTGHIDERDDGDAEGVGKANEPGRVHWGVVVDGSRQYLRLVADDAYDVAAKPAEPDDDVGREERLHLEELTAIQHSRDNLAHVVRLVGRFGNDRLQLDIGTFEVVGRRHEGRPLRVRGGQIGQKLAHAGRAFGLSLR